MRYNLNVSGHGCKLIEASIINFICSLTASEGDYKDVIDELEDLLLKINNGSSNQSVLSARNI